MTREASPRTISLRAAWWGVDFAKLKERTAEELCALGMQRWDEPDKKGRTLWLLPGAIYDMIPAGVRVETINGERKKFKPGKTDRDVRFGALAYGVRVKA